MQRKKRIRLILPLNYICLQRPKNTGDVPRSARSNTERERRGRKERGLSRERGGQAQEKEREREKEERQEEDSGNMRELGKRAKSRAKPFSISQRGYTG